MNTLTPEVEAEVIAFVRECDRLTGEGLLATRFGSPEDDRDLTTRLYTLVAKLPAPVDPDLIEARKIAAEVYRDKAWVSYADEIALGQKDSDPAVSAALAALARGRQLAGEAK